MSTILHKIQIQLAKLREKKQSWKSKRELKSLFLTPNINTAHNFKTPVIRCLTCTVANKFTI